MFDEDFYLPLFLTLWYLPQIPFKGAEGRDFFAPCISRNLSVIYQSISDEAFGKKFQILPQGCKIFNSVDFGESRRRNHKHGTNIYKDTKP
jgi:hypothetical protein